MKHNMFRLHNVFGKSNCKPITVCSGTRTVVFLGGFVNSSDDVWISCCSPIHIHMYVVLLLTAHDWPVVLLLS